MNKEKRTDLGEGCQLVETKEGVHIYTPSSHVALSNNVYRHMIAHSAPEVFKNPE